jgi:hypothetical protein
MFPLCPHWASINSCIATLPFLELERCWCGVSLLFTSQEDFLSQWRIRGNSCCSIVGTFKISAQLNVSCILLWLSHHCVARPLPKEQVAPQCRTLERRAGASLFAGLESEPSLQVVCLGPGQLKRLCSRGGGGVESDEPPVGSAVKLQNIEQHSSGSHNFDRVVLCTTTMYLVLRTSDIVLAPDDACQYGVVVRCIRQRHDSRNMGTQERVALGRI